MPLPVLPGVPYEGRHERRPLHTAGGAAHQLPGHLPAGRGAVEPQRGRPGRLPGHPVGDRAPGPLRLVVVFLAAAALLGAEVAIFEATGDGLTDLLRLHIHPWWLLLHGYGIGSLITWPMLVFACQAPSACRSGPWWAPCRWPGERLAAGADWSPYSQRQALVARCTPSARSPGPPATTTSPPTPPHPHRASPYPAATCTPGCADGGSSRWSSPPASSGWPWPCSASPAPARPSPLRRVWIAAQGRHAGRLRRLQGHRSGPGLAGHLRLPARQPGRHRRLLAHPTADCWRGMAWPSPTACWPWRTGPAKAAASTTGGWPPWPSSWPAPHPPAAPQQRPVPAPPRPRKLQQLWRGDPTAQQDLEQLAADPHRPGRGPRPLGLLPRPSKARPMAAGAWRRRPGRAHHPDHRQPHRRRRRRPPGPGRPGPLRHEERPGG